MEQQVIQLRAHAMPWLGAMLLLLVSHTAGAGQFDGWCFPGDGCMGPSPIDNDKFSTCEELCSMGSPAKIDGLDAFRYSVSCEGDHLSEPAVTQTIFMRLGAKALAIDADGITELVQCSEPGAPQAVAQLTPAEEVELQDAIAQAEAKARVEEEVAEERLGNLTLHQMTVELRSAHEANRVDDARWLAKRISELRSTGTRVGVLDFQSEWWDDDHPILFWSLIGLATLLFVVIALTVVAIALGLLVRAFRWGARL